MKEVKDMTSEELLDNIAMCETVIAEYNASLKEEGINLLEDEQIVERIKPQPVLQKFFFLWCMGVLVICFFAWVFMILFFDVTMVAIDISQKASTNFSLTASDFFHSFAKEINSSFQPYLFMLWAIAFLVGYFVAVMVSRQAYKNNVYYLTNRRVIIKSGWFKSYQLSSLPYKKISNVILSRSLLENMLEIPSLKIETVGSKREVPEDDDKTLYALANPEKVQNLILEQMDKTSS
jgi:uncharacterized membrane protein YdbT with pleckstrin-like domain